MATTTSNGGTGVTISSGIAKASRETTPPVVTPNAAKTQLTVGVTDNKAVVKRGVYIDSTRLGGWQEEYIYSADNTMVYDTSGVGPGQHSLTVIAKDGSGNQVTTTIQFNK